MLKNVFWIRLMLQSYKVTKFAIFQKNDSKIDVQINEGNYSVHHKSPHFPQQNGELKVCNI